MHRLLLRFLQPSSVLGGLVLVAAVLNPTITRASSPFLTIPDPATVETTAAYRYANMTNDEAIAELDRRSLPYITVDPVPGVRAPIRLTGRLHGVLVHSGMAPNQRATSPFEILDARLALALDDFTAILEKHDIDEIEHFSMYRPNVAHKPAAPKIRIPVAAVLPQPVEALLTKPGIDKGATDKPATDKPAADKPATDKPATIKVAKRNKIVIPRPSKKQTAASQPKKPPPKVVIHPKIASSAAPSTAEKLVVPVPTKGQEKPARPSIGKGGLGPKTIATDKKGAKQKAPGESDDTAEKNKPVEMVTEPPKKEDVSTTQTSPAVTPPGTRHPGGLAIDVGKLRKKDGTWITVAGHFHGKIGDKACGADAPVPVNADARELRALVCEAMGDHLFTYVLTPNYNAAHFDHFHMEIKPGVKWFLVH